MSKLGEFILIAGVTWLVAEHVFDKYLTPKLERMARRRELEEELEELQRD